MERNQRNLECIKISQNINKNTTGNKKRYYTLVKQKREQLDLTIINLHGPKNTVSNYVMQQLIDRQRK